MKSMNAMALAGLVALTTLLAACGKTKNDSNASTPATNTNVCANAHWNGYTYVDNTTNQPVNCNYGTGTAVPQYQTSQSCDGWTQWVLQNYGVYAYYVPVQLGNGQMICMNTDYLYQSYPQYNWDQYAYNQQSLYYYDPYSYGGCGSSIYLNYDFGSGNIGGNLCLNDLFH